MAKQPTLYSLENAIRSLTLNQREVSLEGLDKDGPEYQLAVDYWSALERCLTFLKPLEQARKEMLANRIPERREIEEMWLEAGVSPDEILKRLTTLRPIREGDDHQTLEEFVKGDGLVFNDYDGEVYYAMEGYVSKDHDFCLIDIQDPHDSLADPLEVGWTHVVWYNK